MKRTIAASACAALIVAPAFAAKVSVKFESEEGAQTWVFDDATNTATAPTGDTGPYTWDEAAATLCGATPDGGEVCVVFDDVVREVNASTGYTRSDGLTGTATIVAIEE